MKRLTTWGFRQTKIRQLCGQELGAVVPHWGQLPSTWACAAGSEEGWQERHMRMCENLLLAHAARLRCSTPKAFAQNREAGHRSTFFLSLPVKLADSSSKNLMHCNCLTNNEPTSDLPLKMKHKLVFPTQNGVRISARSSAPAHRGITFVHTCVHLMHPLVRTHV